MKETDWTHYYQGKKSFFLLIYALLCTMTFPIFIYDTSIAFSNSVFAIFFFVASFLLLQKAHQITGVQFLKNFKEFKRTQIFTHVLGFVFSCMVALGYALDKTGGLPFVKIGIVIVLFTHLIACTLQLFWQFLMRTDDYLCNYTPASKFTKILVRIVDFAVLHPYCIVFFLLLCWTPCFIAEFPGGFRYDATAELAQIENGFRGDFPLLHSVIITRLLPFCYKLTGTYDTGVTVYVITQMILMAFMYTHIFTTFARRGVQKILLFVAVLYVACFPVIQILVVQQVRDVLFSALLTYAIFLFYLMTSDSDAFWQSKIKPFVLALVFVLTLLARNNNAGFVALFICLAISASIWLIYRKKSFRGVTIFATSTIVLYCALGALLTSLCQPLTPAERKSSLSFMSQSIARAYDYEKEKWSEEDIKELEKYINMKYFYYDPNNADYTKSILAFDDFSTFFKFWCKIGLRHPKSYVQAILINTKKMWFPNSVIDGYRPPRDPLASKDKCYIAVFTWNEEPVGHANIAPKLLNFYEKIGLHISFEKIPLVSMLFSIGFQFWLILNSFCYILYKRKKSLVLPIAILLGYMLISAFVPLVLLRYFAAAFLAFPFVLVFTMQPSHAKIKKKIKKN